MDIGLLGELTKTPISSRIFNAFSQVPFEGLPRRIFGSWALLSLRRLSGLVLLPLAEAFSRSHWMKADVSDLRDLSTFGKNDRELAPAQDP